MLTHEKTIMKTPEEQGQIEHKRRKTEGRAARFITFCALYLAPVVVLVAALGQWAIDPSGADRWISIGDIRLISAEVVQNHFMAVIGLPMAGILALWVVTILRSQSGPIEFEAVGFKFRGASGPVVLWIACFLSIAIAIRLLW